MEHLYNDGYEDWTRYTYVVRLKKYYRWKLKTLPEYIEKLIIKIRDNGKSPDDSLSFQEVKKQIESSKNARDRALISMLFDSG